MRSGATCERHDALLRAVRSKVELPNTPGSARLHAFYCRMDRIRRAFLKMALTGLLTLSDPRSGVLTLTDPRTATKMGSCDLGGCQGRG